MRLNTRSMALGAWAITAGLLVLGLAAHALGLQINLTPSMPIGLYQVRARSSSQPLQRGVLVLLCPSDTPAFRLALHRNYIGAGSCPNHRQPLLKPVAAVVGDTVILTPHGVRVNQTCLPNSQVSTRDSGGRPLPHLPFGRYVVQPGKVWLLSTHSPQSYDSRYFGPVEEARITTTVTPLWTGD